MGSLIVGFLLFVTRFILSGALVGQDACLQIYSVPRQTVICEPSEEVKVQLQTIQENIQTQQEDVVAINTRINNLDPDRPKVLPEHVTAKLARIDWIKSIQENQSEVLLNLTDRLMTLSSAVAAMGIENRQEFTGLISMQTDLITAMWSQSNKTIHGEYIDSLNDTVTHFLIELHQLELKLTETIVTKESQLLSSLSQAAALSRLELETANAEYIERLQAYDLQLETEIESRLDHLNLTIAHGDRMAEVELQMQNMVLRQAIHDEHQTKMSDQLANLGRLLDAKDNESRLLEEKLSALQENHDTMSKDLAACHSATANLADEVSTVKETVERWAHLTPRTLRVHDCQDALRFYYPVSGVYAISPSPALQPIDVYCDMEADSGWTVIQRRQNGSVDFFKGWQDYMQGFGDAAGEYWIGLEAMHVMTSYRVYSLRVDLQDWRGKWWQARYDKFMVDGEGSNYTLHVSGYQGDAGDSLSYHDNMPFTTMDRNNDKKDGLCATWCHGAWWYKDCFLSNLNGRYYNKGPYVPDTNWGDGVNWKTTFNTYYYSFRTAAMKIKPVT